MSDTRWYATRSSTQARTDEDRAMAHQQLGPFESRGGARSGLISHLRAGVERALGADSGSVAAQFGPQYLGLLVAMALDTEGASWGHEGVTWRVWSSTPIPFEQTECEPVAAVIAEKLPEIIEATEGRPGPRTTALRIAGAVSTSVADGSVVFSASDLSQAMRTALLEEHASMQTARALHRRGMVTDQPTIARRGHYPLPLTEAGRRAAEELRAELDAAPIVPVTDDPALPPVDESLVRATVVPLPVVPTPVTVALNVADLTPRMRTALLNTRHMAPEDRLDGNDLSGTIVALVNRGLVEAGGDGRRLPLTEAGLRARARLEGRMDGVPVTDDPALPPVDESLVRATVPGESWDGWSAFGYLARAVEHHLTGQSSAAQLRADLASVTRAVNAGRASSDVSEMDLAWMGGAR